MPNEYANKRVADPVHGTVGLSVPEVELLSTRAVQRLRNVKQLGLAHFVFPGADYSRLSHCIGVCHVTSRILDSLRSYADVKIEEPEYQEYRLAGLLHDIGHFPFSHAFEEAVSDYYREKATPAILDADATVSVDESLDHEGVGGLLLEHDDEITSTFERYGVSADTVFSIFARTVPQRFSNLISSDLDADRIDYLLRTALPPVCHMEVLIVHTGLPYGSVDIEYILSQLRLDSENRIYLTHQALRTAEHFLFGRYFDYQQVSYHKTVAALEEVLKDIVAKLLETGAIDCSKSGIRKMVDSGDWYRFDDAHILQIIRDLETGEASSDPVLGTKVNSLLRRVPPKLIGSIEFIDDRERIREHNRNIRDLERVSSELSEEFDIPPDLWYVWDSKGRSLTKVASYAPVSTFPTDDDDLEQSIRIETNEGSIPIADCPGSVMRVLAQKALFAARLYVLFPDGREADRERITKMASQKIDHEYWENGK